MRQARGLTCGLALLVGLLAAPATAASPPGLAVARKYREQHAPRILRDFAALLALPNVAADIVGIERNAELLRDRLVEVGVRTELLRIPGANPAVWGELEVPGATRTLGIYVHYDGQPVEGMPWTFGPWTPTLVSAALEAGGSALPLPADGEAVSPLAQRARPRRLARDRTEPA
jgi:hypothetical protein